MPARRVSSVVAVAAAAYAAFTLLALALHGWDPLWFVWIGERYADLQPHGRSGYDGQFIYYLARDGWAAVPHLDSAPYRMQRILYPVLSRMLSGGDPALIPWAMLAINAAAIVATTALVARWLAAHGVSPWLGLMYPFWVGNLMSYSRDLTEPLACALAAGAVVTWLAERRVAAVILLVLAGLARETTILFAAGLAIAELSRGRWRRAVTLAAPLIPMLLWQLYLRQVFGFVPARNIARLMVIPGSSIFYQLSFEPGRVAALLFIGLPMLALVPLAARWLLQAPRDAIAWLVAVNLTFALFLPIASQAHVLLAGRLIAGLVLSLVFILPRCTPRLRRALVGWAVVPTIVWLPVVLWWAPWTAKV